MSPLALARPAARPGWPVALAAALAGALMFVLSIIHNDFPFEYHPDEPSKVAQLVSGTRNYNHPPLMLTLTAGTTRLLGISPRAENFARVGRTLSAVYLAGAVACLTIVAGCYGGTAGAAGAAVALGTNAQAVLAGHFFKEDALFTLGLALTFVAGAVHWRRRGRRSLLALGAAAGLAVSSKYVGGLAVLYALTLTALAAGGAEENRRRMPWTNLGWCALAVAGVVGCCNGWALAEHFEQIRLGWSKGVAAVEGGNQGVGAKVPHLQFVGMFFWFTPVPVLVGAAVFWGELRRWPFRQHADRWLTGLAPLWLLAVFSFSASTAVRYFLPISLGLACVAGVALPGGLRWAAARWRWAARASNARTAGWAAAILLACNLPGLLALLGGFAGDDRAALGEWIARRLPPTAVIAQDALARLPVGSLPQRVVSVPTVADLGDVAALRAQGITHVVVCWYDSRRYVDPRKQPSASAHDFLRRREFYATLPTRARALWKSELRQPYPLRPGLELFSLEP